MILQDHILQAVAEIDPISIPNIFIVSSSFYVLTQPRPTLAMKDGTARGCGPTMTRTEWEHCTVGNGGFVL